MIKVGDWPFVAKIRDGQAHIVGLPHGEHTLPWAESMSVTVGVMGFTFAWEQTLTYTKATPCSASTPRTSPNQPGAEEAAEADETSE